LIGYIFVSTASDIATYLAAQAFSLTFGTNMFIGGLSSELPSTPNICVGIEEGGGLPAEYVMESSAINIDRPFIDILVRGNVRDYLSARNLASNIYSALSQISNTTLSGTYYIMIVPNGSIEDVGLDESSRQLFYMSFNVEKNLS
jgi:hypothetical protein